MMRFNSLRSSSCGFLSKPSASIQTPATDRCTNWACAAGAVANKRARAKQGRRDAATRLR